MIKVAVAGLGPIGLSAAKAVCAERDFQLVGLVDFSNRMENQTLRQIGGAAAEGLDFTVRGEDQIVVTSDLAKGTAGADLVFLTLTPSIDIAIERLNLILPNRCAVLTNCDEVVYPYYRNPDKARQIDQLARDAGAQVLGVGVNPGFAMDFLPLVLATMVRRASSVRAVRRVDIGLRRQTLQARLGLSLPPQKFAELREQKKLWQPSLEDSVAMVCAGMGLPITPGSISLTMEPVLADKPVQSLVGLVGPGYVSGIKAQARWEDDKTSIELELTMALGITDSMDRIEIQGPVSMTVKVPGGIPGDSASVASLINYGRIVRSAAPGLRTVLDLPIPASRFS